MELINDKSEHICVLNREKSLYGFVTQSDIIANMSLPVSLYMSSPVETLTSSSSIKRALEYVKTRHFNRVVVVDEHGNFEGVVSQKELITLTYSKLASLMKAHQNELSEMNSFLEHKNKEYEMMATTDSLTGLYNRHKFLEFYRSSYKLWSKEKINSL